MDRRGGRWRLAKHRRRQTWALKWRARAPLEIGSLAIDPTKPTTLYCGTGEANLSADCTGDGLYRSTNGGTTWQPLAPSETTGLPRRIGAIAVDPFDSEHILVGGIGFGRVSSDNDFGGLYSTTDGGSTWQRLSFISATTTGATPSSSTRRPRAHLRNRYRPQASSNGIYRSRNGGVTWTQLTNGLPID